MADDHKAPSGGGSALEEFGVLIGIFLLLFALWVMRGRPNSAEIRKGLFIAPPVPIGNGAVFGPTLGAPTSTTNSTPQPAPTTQPNH